MVKGLPHQPLFILRLIMTEEKAVKKKATSKKELVKRITDKSDAFDTDSLMRTNAKNIKAILDLL